MFTRQKINNEKVKPVVIVDAHPPEKIKGYDVWPMLISNLAIIAKRKSGKTSLIHTLVKKTTNRDTKFYIFSATAFKDPTWKAILQFLEDRGNDVEVYTSIIEEGANILMDILNELEEKSRIEEMERKQQEQKVEEIKTPQELMIERLLSKQAVVEKAFKQDEPEEKKPRKPAKLAPQLFFILDDQGSMLQDKAVSKLMKITARHNLSKVILSTQYTHDIRPDARSALDFVILFGGHTIEKLEIIHKDMDLSISFDLFLKLYKDATSERYNFLYIDIAKNEFRKNLNEKYNIKDIDELDN